MLKQSIAKSWWKWLLAGFLLVLVSTGIQVVSNLSVESKPRRPSAPYDSGGAERLMYYYGLQKRGEALPAGVDLTEAFVLSELSGTLDYIDARYDAADFRVNTLVRLIYDHADVLPESAYQEIKATLLGFKYWMDQGGEDSMCYWSENHQILFSTGEYLVGQLFPDEIFEVDGKTGLEHKAMAKARVEAWMAQRFAYGFTEWYSNNYYPEDVGPMANFIQFAEDPLMVERMKMVMDIIWFDMASQSWKYDGFDGVLPRTYYVFMSSMGRAYSDNRASDDEGNRMRLFIDYIVQPDATKDFGASWEDSRKGFFNSFRQMIEARNEANEPYYTVPEAIKQIFDDPAGEQILRSSQSLDVEELQGEGLLGLEDPQIMMQFAMEAFTNPSVIDNTMDYIAKHKMFTNDFLNDFKLINLWPLRTLRTLDTVSKLLNPSTNGVAIERANVYTYQTQDYSMSTAQKHQVGDYADQQGVSSINLSNKLSIFTTQPAKLPSSSGTPNYWTGNGRMAHAVQEKNVLIELYLPPSTTGFMEPMIVEKTTHVFFPIERFEKVNLSFLAQGMVFGRLGDAYIAIRARHALSFVPFAISNQDGNKDEMLVGGSVRKSLTQDYDLVQFGEGMHYFVTELSDAGSETFGQFVTRIQDNALSFDSEALSLTYETTLNGEAAAQALEVAFGGLFTKNAVAVNLEYARYENAYVPNGVLTRKPGVIVYQFAGYRVTNDFENGIRTLEK